MQQPNWIPHIIDDPNLPRLVLEGGRQVPGWGLREECVTRILFDSGARISEVVGLSLADWIERGMKQETNAFSKGSGGRRVKFIRFSNETAQGAFVDEHNTKFLELVKAERLVDDAPAQGFWFEELLRQGVLGQGPRCIADQAIAAQQQKWLRSWGYEAEGVSNRVTPFWTQVCGLLTWPQEGGEAAFMRKAQTKAQGFLIPVEPFYAAATFGLLAVDLFTTTGMRMNEAMQIRLGDDCFVRLKLPVPSGAKKKTPSFRYLFRLIPKGERTNNSQDYFIGEETKRLLVKVAKMLEEHYCLRLSQGETLPTIEFDPTNGRAHRFGRAPYLFQYNYKHLPNMAITACMRFLLHGMVFKTRDGKNVVLKAHLLRHAFATHAVQVEKIPLDIVGAWLKQKNLDVTDYYTQPTESIIAQESDFFLARLATQRDVGESVRRSPEELQQQYNEAVKRMGTLTEVSGGSCTCHGFCPAQFACVGCAAKVPEPSKRHQKEQNLNATNDEILTWRLKAEQSDSKDLVKSLEAENWELKKQNQLTMKLLTENRAELEALKEERARNFEEIPY